MIKTKNLLLENIKNQNAFFDILLSIPEEYLEKILLLLKKEQELDFFLLARQAIKNDYEVFKLNLVLDKLVFTSILNVNTILALYTSLTSLHYEYITLSITEKLIEISSKFSLCLYEEMIKETKEFMVSHISILFLAFYKSKKQYKELVKLIDNKNIFIVQSAVEIFSFFKLSSAQSKEVFSLFTSLFEKKELNLDKTILLTASKLKDEYVCFENILELYVKDEREEIKYSISKILLVNKTKDLEKPWFKSSLFSLTNLNNYDKEVLRNISFILNNIINEKQDYKIIIEFFKKYISETEIKTDFPQKDFSFFIKNFSQNHKTIFDEFLKEINFSKNEDLIKLSSFFVSEREF